MEGKGRVVVFFLRVKRTSISFDRVYEFSFLCCTQGRKAANGSRFVRGKGDIQNRLRAQNERLSRG